MSFPIAFDSLQQKLYSQVITGSLEVFLHVLGSRHLAIIEELARVSERRQPGFPQRLGIVLQVAQVGSDLHDAERNSVEGYIVIVGWNV